MFYVLYSSWTFVCTYGEEYLFICLVGFCSPSLLVFAIWNIIFSAQIDFFLLEFQGIYIQSELLNHLKGLIQCTTYFWKYVHWPFYHIHPLVGALVTHQSPLGKMPLHGGLSVEILAGSWTQVPSAPNFLWFPFITETLLLQPIVLCGRRKGAYPVCIAGSKIWPYFPHALPMLP